MKEKVKKVNLLEPVDVDSINVRRDHYFPNAYIIDLPLDSTPDHVWQDIFERKWKSSRHLWDRKLFSIGDRLRLVTTYHDLKEKISWVRRVIEETNKGIDEYNGEAEARVTQMEEQMRKGLLEEDARVEEIKDVLRKSFGPT